MSNLPARPGANFLANLRRCAMGVLAVVVEFPLAPGG